jgi:hypothetical protein
MNIDIDKAIITDFDGTTMATLEVVDADSIELKIENMIISHDNIDEFCRTLKEAYFTIFKEHEDKRTI